MQLALALRDRLPEVGALLTAGELPPGLATQICWHAGHLQDPATLALIDAAMAGSAHGRGPLSKAETIRQIDSWIEKFHPAAVCRSRNAVRATDGDRGDTQIKLTVPEQISHLDPCFAEAQNCCAVRR